MSWIVSEQQETFEQFLERNVSADDCSADGCAQTELRFRWLGQAGFCCKWGQTCFAIDPYLSDSLAVKYRGRRFPHIRMSPPPVLPEQLNMLDFVFCTHAHSDHLDPGTLPILVNKNPSARFVIPRSAVATAKERGVPEGQMLTVNVGDVIPLTSEMRLAVVESAHETLQKDEQGNAKFLGYILEYTPTEIHTKSCATKLDSHTMRLYHGGDGISYPELPAILRTQRIDIAMLPVNGRDAFRAANGVPGNFTFDEAANLCLESRIPICVPDHFGMFDFNTLDEKTLDENIQKYTNMLRCVRLRYDQTYTVHKA